MYTFQISVEQNNSPHKNIREKRGAKHDRYPYTRPPIVAFHFSLSRFHPEPLLTEHVEQAKSNQCCETKLLNKDKHRIPASALKLI